MYKPTNTVSYIRRSGADPELILKLTTQKIERRSLKLVVNCIFLTVFFFVSLICSSIGLLLFGRELGTVQLTLEAVDSAVSLLGVLIGGFGIWLSRNTEFKPVEKYYTTCILFGMLYVALFAAKVGLEMQSETDVLGLFRSKSALGALFCYALILVVMCFFVAKFVILVRKFGADLVQLKAHTIPLLKSVQV